MAVNLEGVTFKNYVNGLTAATSSDLKGAKNFVLNGSEGVVKLIASEVASASDVGAFESVEDFSTVSEYDKQVGSDGNWYTGKHKSLKLFKGWTYEIECLLDSPNGGSYAILDSSFVEGSSLSGSVPFSENYPSRISIGKGVKSVFTALDDDAYLVISTKNSGGGAISISVKKNGGNIQKVFDKLKDDVNVVGAFREIDFSDVVEYASQLAGSGSWYTYGKHKSFKLNKGWKYKLNCSTDSESNGSFAVLDSSFIDGPSLSGSAPFSENYPSRIAISKGDYFEFVAAESDGFLAVNTEDAGENTIVYSLGVCGGDLKNVRDSFSELSNYLGRIQKDDFSSVDEYNNQVGSDGNWYTGKHKSLKINKGVRYDVTVLDDSLSDGNVAVLNSTFVDGPSLSGSVPFSENYPERIIVRKGETFTFVARDDDCYIVVGTQNSGGQELKYFLKSYSGALGELSDGKSTIKFRILEYNVGGFQNGLGFTNPSVEVCKDLHKFIRDERPDVFIPCEVTNGMDRFYNTIRSLFDKVNFFPNSFPAYSVAAHMNLNDVSYKTLFLYRDVSTKESYRNLLMASFMIHGCKIALVPWHGHTLNASGTWGGLTWDQIEANLDDFFTQIKEDDYDVVILCGDTNVFWNYDDNAEWPNNFNVVKYFVDKGYHYVNGGSASTSQEVDLDFAENFAENTDVNIGIPNHAKNIDNLVMRSVSGKFDIAVTFNVFNDDYLNAKYPSLRGATYPDHLPSVFDVTICSKK